MLGLLRRLDDWRRQRRWRDERAALFTAADVLVVSHTKSGRTWLRVLMSHIYHLRYGVPENQLLRAGNFHAFNSAIPSVHFTRDTRFPPETADDDAVLIAPRQKVIFLVRDPRDVAVSFYFHVSKRASTGELARKNIPESARQLPLWDFVIDERLGVPRIIGFYNRWAQEAKALPQHVRVRYEDLRADTAGELRRVMQLTDFEPTTAELEAAVRFASFDNMKQHEQQGFFASGRLGATDRADPASVKVREGRVGGWRKRFTPKQAAVLDDLVIRTLDPTLGYGAAAQAMSPERD